MPTSLVALDESSGSKVSEEGLHVGGVIGEKAGLDALRPVLQAPILVRQRPQANEEQASFRAKRGKFFVQEEVRLD
jgi:hypothetical protein